METKMKILSKEELDAIDLANADSNFTDALWDTAKAQAHLTAREIIERIEGEGLISPDKNSITQFESFYHVSSSLIKTLKKEFGL